MAKIRRSFSSTESTGLFILFIIFDKTIFAIVFMADETVAQKYNQLSVYEYAANV